MYKCVIEYIMYLLKTFEMATKIKYSVKCKLRNDFFLIGS